MTSAKKLLTVLGSAGYAKLPYSVDFTAQTDGALPNNWNGTAWAISSAKAINTPTLSGTELINNPGFEGTYSSGLAPNWTKYPAGTVVSESSDVHGGTAAQYVGNATSNGGQVTSTNFALVAGDWVRCHGYYKVTGSAILRIQQGFGSYTVLQQVTLAGADYTQNFMTAFIPESGNHGLSPGALNHATAETNNIIADDHSTQKLTASTLSAVYDIQYRGVLKVRASMRVGIVGQPAGIIGWWDKDNLWQNMLIAYHDGETIKFEKLVGSVWTKLIGVTTATYAADADIEIRRLTGTNTFQLWYNDSQVGANQTISDTEIINNKYFGLLSTGESNSFDAFFLE